MLLYFILGVLFIEVGIPIIEAIVTLILTWIKVAKGSASLKITKMSADITKIQEGLEEDKTPKRLIGFQVPVAEEIYEEEEEDE